ncbi:hypothetical protein [Curtobacterium sp. YR515]|uniref:hypothetical protein n=1 Tax=Curtobacterium sp. YR515 TaxID=1855316 RepID=UPI001113FAB1|nr:hypothetical protein [Curtobacterium sp. YR515]
MPDRWQEHPPAHKGSLQHTAFEPNLPMFEVVAKFWVEVRKILPAEHVHVIDPYMLDAGGEKPATYAANVAALLKPAITNTRRLTFVYQRTRGDVGRLLKADIDLLNASTAVTFHQGSGMHARYIVADRSRVLRMEFSFNRIGKSFGTVSQVLDEEDRSAIVAELDRLHPSET